MTANYGILGQPKREYRYDPDDYTDSDLEDDDYPVYNPHTFFGTPRTPTTGDESDEEVDELFEARFEALFKARFKTQLQEEVQEARRNIEREGDERIELSISHFRDHFEQQHGHLIRMAKTARAEAERQRIAAAELKSALAKVSATGRHDRTELQKLLNWKAKVHRGTNRISGLLASRRKDAMWSRSIRSIIGFALLPPRTGKARS